MFFPGCFIVLLLVSGFSPSCVYERDYWRRLGKRWFEQRWAAPGEVRPQLPVNDNSLDRHGSLIYNP
jgi:hypothetical protein